jgi:hypothetical protein
MALEEYEIGDAVELYATFLNASAAAADPTDVTFTTVDPAGAETTYTWTGGSGGSSADGVTRSGVGAYAKIVTPTVAGVWHYRRRGTGAVITADQGYFLVRASPFA